MVVLIICALIDSALAQLVEQMTVNHWVAGSSPAGGATNFSIAFLLCLLAPLS